MSRWIAHYVAEQISASEKAHGSQKEVIKKRCFESILQLWEHRASYSGGKNPFDGFGPIFNALSRIDPENTGSYHNALRWAQEQSNNGLDDNKEVQKWINVALNLDKITKILLEYSLTQAVHNAKNEKTKEWLNNSIGLPGDDDVSVILSFLPSDTDERSEKDKELEKIKKRFEELNGFEQMCKLLRETYQNEIKILSDTDENNDN